MKIDELIGAIEACRNPSALGLDTRIEFVPEALARGVSAPDAVYRFNAALLEGLKGIIPCVKIQAAYYELMGVPGMKCMSETIDEARRQGYIVIVDAKRGDIGATASAYSGAFLAEGAPFRADFLTVNPYLGYDGIKPFVDDCRTSGAGIFVLVKTSNPSSGEFQDVRTNDGRTLFERVAEKVSEWGSGLIGKRGYSSICAVVGATYPQQGALLRRAMPRTFFLLPGYGAQGASAKGLARFFDHSGGGAIVAASRSIICAHVKKGGDFVEAARDEALRMKEEIGNAIHIAT